MNKKLHFFIVPLVLVAVSFLIEPRCTQGLCLFPGRGLPLGYYYDGIFRTDAFLIDYIFFFVVYVVPVLWVKDVRQWLTTHTGKGKLIEIQDKSVDPQ